MEKVDSANMKKLRFLPIAFSREKKTIWLMFRYYKCLPAIKINGDCQMTIISNKIYVMDNITSLAALY